MVEVAISLAIIGIALVAIIGVLPLGMNVQRDNREQTIINQDATIFMEAIRHGARGADDLTNYVYAITNYQTVYPGGNPVVPTPGWNTSSYLTNGANIIGLLSTPEYTDPNNNNVPIYNPVTFNSYNSNHIVAYVRSMSGPAVEKPPQDNPIIQQDSFSYRILCVNASMQHYTPPIWQSVSYNAGDSVSYYLNGQTTYWQAIVAGTPSSPPQPSDTPNISVRWSRVLYPQELDENSHELRLTFLWPQLPSGKVGAGHQTFRALVAGQIFQTNQLGQVLYFYQSQSFTNAP